MLPFGLIRGMKENKMDGVFTLSYTVSSSHGHLLPLAAPLIVSLCCSTAASPDRAALVSCSSCRPSCPLICRELGHLGAVRSHGVAHLAIQEPRAHTRSVGGASEVTLGRAVRCH